MKFHFEQAGLWLKPNTQSQLKPDMPQADISTFYVNTLLYIKWNMRILPLEGFQYQLNGFDELIKMFKTNLQKSIGITQSNMCLENVKKC